jgi:hypothetical protein
VRSPRRRPSLYRTVLSIAVAALIAAWLPFSVLYVTAVHNHAQAVAASKPTTQGPASGSGHAAQPLASVKTRTS